MREIFSRLKVFAATAITLAALCVHAANAPDPKVFELATKLIEAKNAAAEERLLAQADPGVAGQRLSDEIAKREFEISLQGDYVEAERLCYLIRSVAQRTKDEDGLAVADTQLSAVLREYGEYPEALAALDRALAYYHKHPDSLAAVRTFQSRGIILLYQGDFARALVDLTHALQLAEKSNYREGIIPALNSIGEIYREQGLPERALEFYEKARAIVANDAAWNMAFIFNNIGMSYEAMGDLPKAIDFIARAKSVAEKNKMRPRVATSFAVLAKIALQQGKLDEAQKLYEQSLALSRELRDPTSEGRALAGLSEVSRARGEFQKAVDYAQQASVIFQKADAPDRVIVALTAMGRSLLALGKENDARHAFQEAISNVEKLRGNIAGAETESEAFLEARLGPYQEMISLLANAGQNEAALAMAERASARVLLDVVSRGGTRLSHNVLNESEAARQRSLDRKIAELNHNLTREHAAEHVDEKQLAQMENDLRAARNDREDLDVEVAAVHPELRSSPPEPIQSLTELAPLTANRETVLLKFAVGEKQAWLFAIVADTNGSPSLEIFPIRISRAELSKRVTNFRTKLAERSLDWQKPARELYDLLLRPVESKWRAAHRLIIVPDSVLWECPFQALPNGENHLLLEQCAISLAPSLSILTRLENSKPAGNSPNNLVVFANPALPKVASPLTAASNTFLRTNWEPLPEMERQARELEHLYSNSAPKIFVGSNASEEIAKREMPAANVLQFATHGVLNDRSPLYSYLLLAQSEPAGSEDGMLEAWELMHMRLRARLAVLCGCETARGHVGAGEGVIGLSWSFFVADCPATIVSQWKVDSASARPLMLALHRQLLSGASKTDALRNAALELRKDEHYRHPFYWAPFVLVGDPR